MISKAVWFFCQESEFLIICWITIIHQFSDGNEKESNVESDRLITKVGLRKKQLSDHQLSDWHPALFRSNENHHFCLRKHSETEEKCEKFLHAQIIHQNCFSLAADNSLSEKNPPTRNQGKLFICGSRQNKVSATEERNSRQCFWHFQSCWCLRQPLTSMCYLSVFKLEYI